MKITLTELRQMVRNIISEMDDSVKYELQLPYQDWSGAGDKENFYEGNDMNRLIEVKELTEKELNYNIIGTMPYEHEDQAEEVNGERIKGGVFGKMILKKRETKYVDYNDKCEYQYEIYVEEGNDVHVIIVDYHEVRHSFDDKNDFRRTYESAESFIFYGYPN